MLKLSPLKYIIRTYTGCDHPVKTIALDEMKSKILECDIKYYTSKFSRPVVDDPPVDVVLHRHYHDPDNEWIDKLPHIHHKISERSTHVKCDKCCRFIRYKNTIARFETGECRGVPFESDYKMVSIRNNEQNWYLYNSSLDPISNKMIFLFILVLIISVLIIHHIKNK